MDYYTQSVFHPLENIQNSKFPENLVAQLLSYIFTKRFRSLAPWRSSYTFLAKGTVILWKPFAISFRSGLCQQTVGLN